MERENILQREAAADHLIALAVQPLLQASSRLLLEPLLVPETRRQPQMLGLPQLLEAGNSSIVTAICCCELLHTAAGVGCPSCMRRPDAAGTASSPLLPPWTLFLIPEEVSCAMSAGAQDAGLCLRRLYGCWWTRCAVKGGRGCVS